MIKVVINGVLGKMGSAVVRAVDKESDIELIAGVERKGHPLVGENTRATLGVGSAPIVDSLEAVIEGIDCIVEFTSPLATLAHLRIASSAGTRCVIGTTGFAEGELKEIEKLASEVACVLSPNMAPGVNLIFELVRVISGVLQDYDCEIIETHHRQKSDSPSGTALRLADIISETRGRRVSELAKYGRRGSQIRDKGEIGIHSVRGGEIVGEHTVLWAGGGERIEVSHSTYSREVFAHGTISAIRWVADRTPGLYAMKDVLGL
jgi:4-hydroxy-tetrahydrodipicolinate reductase